MSALASVLNTVMGYECRLASIETVAPPWSDAMGIIDLMHGWRVTIGVTLSAVIVEAVLTLGELVRDFAGRAWSMEATPQRDVRHSDGLWQSPSTSLSVYQGG
jgi:uncharacterized membrane protein